MMILVDGTRQSGHQRKIWCDGIMENMKRLGLCQEDAQCVGIHREGNSRGQL